MKRTNEKGITLIALVITIIVLLILAGVSINLVVGQNGVLNKAQTAATETKRASIEETINLEFAGAYDSNGRVDMSTLSSSLLSKGATSVLHCGDGVIATFEGINYYIDEVGEVSIVENVSDNIIEANKPKLSSGMIPVKYNGTNWVICSDTDPEWYSYTKTKKQWANIMLSDGKYDVTAEVGTVVQNDELGSMFVWIPRYGYKITSGYKSQKGGLDIVWLKETTNEYSTVENNRMIKKTITANNPVLNDEKTAYTDYVVHPCFTNGTANGFKNGEWDKELSGIWVAKFEGGYPMADNENDSKTAKTFTVGSDNLYYPVFKGQKYTYNYLSVSQMYSLLRAINGTSNPYGLENKNESHLMKNSEWGAIAYLSYSGYGIGNNTEAKEMSLNNLGLKSSLVNSIASREVYIATGYAGEHEASQKNPMAQITVQSLAKGLTEILSDGTGNSYAWYTAKGALASTTGNIYGIYDMVGGQPELTAAYVDYGTEESTLNANGASFTNDGNSKYATAYMATDTVVDYRATESFKEWTLENGYFGDGLFEVSMVDDLVESGYYTWYEDYQQVHGSHNPFFVRGGSLSLKDQAGIFYFSGTTGKEWIGTNAGFRAVLVGE